MSLITKESIEHLIQITQFEYVASQRKICLQIIKRIYSKMMSGLRFDGIKVCDNVIIDGHHRYLASKLAKYQLDVYPTFKTSVTVEIEWREVDFELADWDTDAKIKVLNEIDALNNGISIFEINQILNI